MSGHIGKQAVVVGAGMGGLAAAGALADYFERVVVLERDVLPAGPAARRGTPQARHPHGLLAGGLEALCDLFPGFDRDLAAAGAVKVRAGLGIRVEQPGFDPFPQRDLGWDNYFTSRPLTEFTLRRRVEQLANVTFRQGVRAEAFTASLDGGRVTGVRMRADDGPTEVIAADLAVDASSGGLLTLQLLEFTGRPMPEETIIGVDLGYATAIFERPCDAPKDWNFLLTSGRRPGDCHSGGVFPMEEDLWMVVLAGYGRERPPGDPEGYMAFARGLRRPTLFDAIRDAKPVGEIVRYRFPASVRRHYERLRRFPRGLLPFSDAICRFNPAYGQGMSVAAQEARLLRRLLGAWAEGDPLGCLADNFFVGVQALIETPWNMVTALDFRLPQTQGARPPDFEQSSRVAAALMRLAAEDPEVHRVWQQVAQLLKPASALTNPALITRVMAMAA